MPYSPSEPTPLDVIRGLAGDTSNDPETEIIPDATYVAILGRFGVGVEAGTPTTTSAFYRAAAEILRRVMDTIAARPTSINDPEEGSMSWSGRLDGLKSKIAMLDAQAVDAEAQESTIGFGPVVTIHSRYMTGTRERGRTW